MAFPTYTYTFTNGTTADATQVNQNFTDILNGISDTTKDISVASITGAAGGTQTFNGNVVLGSSSSKTITFNGSLASSIPIGTTNSFDIGAATTQGLRSIYFSSAAAAFTTRLVGQTTAANVTATLPSFTGTLRNAAVPTITVLSGSGTYTPPSNLLYFVARAVGGGGGGGGGGNGSAGFGAGGGAGGAGGWAEKTFVAPLNASYSYGVGAQGNGNTTGSPAGTGGNGGITTFATGTLSCTGGNGGSGGSTINNPGTGGAGGAASGGDLNIPGGAGATGMFGVGGSSQGFGGNGGSNPIGFGGGAGGAAGNYGGGGGGGNGGGTGGNGTPGTIIILEYI